LVKVWLVPRCMQEQDNKQQYIYRTKKESLSESLIEIAIETFRLYYGKHRAY